MKKNELVINVFYDDCGIDINDVLEQDFRDFLNDYIKKINLLKM